jgi:LPXTG-motif cell wall-anchored protein
VAPTSTINPGTINPSAIDPSAIESTTTTVFDPCVVPTTIPGTIVPTGASTTSPTIQPTGTTAKLPTTGGNTEPSGRTIALIILIGASLIIMSRRQVRRAIAERDPS